MFLNISARLLQRVEDFCGEADHPWTAFLKREGGEGNDEFSDVVGGIEHFHRGSDGGFAVIDEDDIRVADVLEIEFDDFVGAVDLTVDEFAAHGIQKAEFRRKESFCLLPLGSCGSIMFIHDGAAEINDKTFLFALHFFLLFLVFAEFSTRISEGRVT